MQTIVLIGAGYSGLVSAVQMIRQANGKNLNIQLIERRGKTTGRGLAYDACQEEHFLNVPAGNMSAFDDEPEHFLNYCQKFDSSILPSTFVKRSVYGDYLEWVLSETQSSLPPQISLTQIIGEVTNLEVATGTRQIYVTLNDGREIMADKVVLATGNHQPQNPQISNPAFYSSARYVSDPWKAGAITQLNREIPTLLVGTGLTALDISASLIASPGKATIYAISRHGLIPQSHRTHRTIPTVDYFSRASEAGFGSLRERTRAIRNCVAAVTSEGGDWREVVGSLRPHTQQLWETFNDRDKSRFLRHLRAHWEVHRHRVAPEPYDNFQRVLNNGSIKILAGRIINIQETATEIEVTVKLRHEKKIIQIKVGQVINCTGPGSNIEQMESELMMNLINKGMIRRDSLGLGLDIASNYATVDKNGKASPVLFYIGPLLRSRYWEATAVPELRVFARKLAETILSDDGTQ